eukprot:1840514-Pleurochrysis_carterae.AAC.1
MQQESEVRKIAKTNTHPSERASEKLRVVGHNSRVRRPGTRREGERAEGREGERARGRESARAGKRESERARERESERPRASESVSVRD